VGGRYESKPCRSRWPPTAGLAAIAVLVAGIGLAIAAAQHPRSPLVRTPPPKVSATPSPFPTPPAAGPITALGASVVDDPATHRVVLFGGVDSINKTWLWVGRHPQPPAYRLAPRLDASPAFRPGR
jgi:hypothetical protein